MKTVILKSEKVIPFDIDGMKGEFVCNDLKASDQVGFWAQFRAIEGTEESKAKAQAELISSKFLNSIKEIRFEEETNFKDQNDNPIDPKTALEEYFSMHIYQAGLKYLTPNIGGSGKDPLELSSNAS